MFERYPWHEGIWNQILTRYHSGTLPHALLLTGNNGIGKRDFALQLAHLLLCESYHTDITDLRNAYPCGQCQACGLNKASTHPDLKWVAPESDGKIITIDQIRELSQYLSLKSQYGRLQIAVVLPAEKMNKFAANSLLKTLEEPSPDSLIILVTNQPSALLPTVRSRCQKIAFPQPNLEVAAQWLKTKTATTSDTELKEMLFLANGGPLEARDYLENNTPDLVVGIIESFSNVTFGRLDPVAVAKLWTETNVDLLIKWLISWTSHMIGLKYGTTVPDNNLVEEDALKKLAAAVDLTALFGFLDKLTEVRQLLQTQANVQLLLEDLLIGWLQLNSTKPSST